MNGSWRWNIGFAVFGAVMTFLFSLSNNPIITSLIRAIYALIAFGVLGLLVRLILSQLLKPAHAISSSQQQLDEERGTMLDLTTPDDGESLSDLMKEQWTGSGTSAGSGFEPLKPPKLVSLDDHSPEEVVQAIRRLTDE